MDKTRNSNHMESERQKQSNKNRHKTLPKLHLLSNREMNELDGGKGKATNHRLGTSFTMIPGAC